MSKSQPYLEYEIYLPTVGPQGALYSQDILQQSRQDLIDFFGGLTDTRQKNEGLWKIGGDDVIMHVKRKLQEVLHQSEILVVRRQVERMLS